MPKHFPAGVARNLTTYRGEVVIVQDEAPGVCGIQRHTLGFKTPKTGNYHNPTARYYWTVTLGGVRMGSAQTLKGARELAAEVVA